jgi:hypothetical protein
MVALVDVVVPISGSDHAPPAEVERGGRLVVPAQIHNIQDGGSGGSGIVPTRYTWKV